MENLEFVMMVSGSRPILCILVASNQTKNEVLYGKTIYYCTLHVRRVNI